MWSLLLFSDSNDQVKCICRKLCEWLFILWYDIVTPIQNPDIDILILHCLYETKKSQHSKVIPTRKIQTLLIVV